MTERISINEEKLMERLEYLGNIGRGGGRLTRLAASDEDKEGRDTLCGWMSEAGLDVKVDRIGNIFGIWNDDQDLDEALMIGSHIDSVIDAGIYDGCYGVLCGLAAVEAMKKYEVKPSRPVIVAAFTNEEGVRYSPDMMGSLVYAGGLGTDEALSAIGTDGTVLGEELERIGYSGAEEPGFIRPSAYIEIHIEQGPVLEHEQIPIGAVEKLQGISWQKITIEGTANHAGTTPMNLRKDAGRAAAEVNAFINRRAEASDGGVSTIGSIKFEPDAINVIPSKAVFTADLRHPAEQQLQELEDELAIFLRGLEEQGFTVRSEYLARFEPVKFDAGIAERIERAAEARNHGVRRMTSGAGHDAQMMSRISPAAMIFVPSRNGISHNPEEFTSKTSLAAGANVLLDVIMDI